MKSTTQFHEFVDMCNTHIDSFITEHCSGALDLGPGYSDLSPEESAYNLRRYRMAKKWSKPCQSDSLRALASVTAMFDYDSNGFMSFNINDVQDKYLRRQIYMTKLHCRDILKGFKMNYSLFGMPSGETSKSSRGYTSIYDKLKSLDQWVCSPSCFLEFSKICYNSPGLKRCARAHINELYGKMTRLSQESGYDCFTRHLKKIITFQDVSRITTVPKNKDVDRVILCEPMCNMIVQRCIAENLVELINDKFELDLYDSQRIHQLLISDDSNSTIDLSNASNSNWWAITQYLFEDTKLLNLLSTARISTVEYKGSYHHLNMIAPMGNGFTFEVMTLTLLCLTRQFDSFSHVFGDDIIVDNMVAQDVVACLNELGYQINETKTFINSPFRESCGGFYSSGYITSFDFWWATNVAEAIVNINKLFYLQQVDKGFCSVYQEIVSQSPPHLLGAVLFYTSWPSAPSMIKYNSVLDLDRCNINLSDHIIVHPRYLAKARMKHSKVKPTPCSRLSNYHVRIESDRRLNFKRERHMRLKGCPFLESHYLYSLGASPLVRRASILIRRRK